MSYDIQVVRKIEVSNWNYIKNFKLYIDTFNHWVSYNTLQEILRKQTPFQMKTQVKNCEKQNKKRKFKSFSVFKGRSIYFLK